MERSTTFRLGDEEMSVVNDLNSLLIRPNVLCLSDRLRATMLQMPEFTDAFNCNSSSLLHHGKVCGRII